MATATFASSRAGVAQTDTRQQQQQPVEDYLPTFFCRALYDYQSEDTSSLTFYRGDLIEVLTQLESGWWDGLLGEERGWFPSNYVMPISYEEAEAELARLDHSMGESDAYDSGVDVGQGHDRRVGYEQDNDWTRQQAEHTRLGQNGNVAHTGPATTNDFWVPRVTDSGQVSRNSYGLPAVVLSGLGRSTM